MKRKPAFSLIELLVALAILAVVSALIIPKFLNVREAAAERTAQAIVKQINKTYLQWIALGGQRNGSSGFQTLCFLSKFPASSTATRTGDGIGDCSDTKGLYGSTVVSLTGIEVKYFPNNNAPHDEVSGVNAPDIMIYGSDGTSLLLKVNRTIWAVALNDSRADPFYIARRFNNIDSSGNSTTTIY
jgi:prepilin-type N-terminal cleavage/methylation domain-containing protein